MSLLDKLIYLIIFAISIMKKASGAIVGAIAGIITFFWFGVDLITAYVPREWFPEASTNVAFPIAMIVWSLPFVILGLWFGKSK